ncbi:hypothetical protein PCL_12191 [Purpureocillium lilacinum]|uniref:Uncharacterized protein n=1 Tax=Purpureocillium lilacinum TaxID=33203 RepID=A0A2U3E8I8_PURLI|nr:hypothetical protein PCL_12191 [Purpureocillium lilacinum]
MASFPGFCRPGRVAEPRSSSINRLWVRHPPARPPVTPEVELPRRVSPLDHRGRCGVAAGVAAGRRILRARWWLIRRAGSGLDWHWLGGGAKTGYSYTLPVESHAACDGKAIRRLELSPSIRAKSHLGDRILAAASLRLLLRNNDTMPAQKDQSSNSKQPAHIPRSMPELDENIDDVKLTAPLFGHECFEAVPRVDAKVRQELPKGASTTLDTIISGKDFAY